MKVSDAKRKAAGVGVLLAAAFLAQATPIPIPGIFSTGTSGEGNADPYYAVSDSPYGAFVTYVVFSNWFPLPSHWTNVSGPGRWISRTAAAQSDPVGWYTFQTTFDLTGLIPATAVIRGQWSSDNSAEIWLNGSFTGVALNLEAPYFDLYPFELTGLTSGFQPGLNTLEFRVSNWDCSWQGGSCNSTNPMGLRVDIMEATAEPVPEPATFAIVGSGVLGLGLLARRYRAK